MRALAIHLCCFILVVSKCMGQGPMTLLPKPTHPSSPNVQQPYVIPVCQEPFFYVEEFKKCYYISDYGAYWTYAKSDCENRTSTIIKLETLRERDFVLRYKGLSGGIWTGASKAANGTIYWTDGARFTPFQGCGAAVPGVGTYVVIANNVPCGLLKANTNYYRVVCEKAIFSN